MPIASALLSGILLPGNCNKQPAKQRPSHASAYASAAVAHLCDAASQNEPAAARDASVQEASFPGHPSRLPTGRTGSIRSHLRATHAAKAEISRIDMHIAPVTGGGCLDRFCSCRLTRAKFSLSARLVRPTHQLQSRSLAQTSKVERAAGVSAHHASKAQQVKRFCNVPSKSQFAFTVATSLPLRAASRRLRR